MTKLSSIPDHQLSITCGLCKHHSMLEVANLIAVVGEDATAHDVRPRYSCPKCKAKGNNTYQIIYRGNSDIALDGVLGSKTKSAFKSFVSKNEVKWDGQFNNTALNYLRDASRD